MKRLIPAILVLLGLVAFMKCDPGSTNSDGYSSGFYYNLEDALKNPRDVWSLSLLGHYDSIPRVITSFQDMGHFSIMGSDIKEVPHWIGELEHLQTLGLSYNQINHVSPGISEMESLYEVNLGNNRLDSLPTDVTFMSHCVTIFLDDNNLRDLPTMFQTFDSSLGYLGLRANPIDEPTKAKIRSWLPRTKIWF